MDLINLINRNEWAITAFFIMVVVLATMVHVLIGLINQNSAAITAFFSVVVGLSTVAYVCLTSKLVSETSRYAHLTSLLVSETKKMREAQTEPKVFITTQPRGGFTTDRANPLSSSIISHTPTRKIWIDLLIQNIGFGPAYDIKFEVPPSMGSSKVLDYKTGEKEQWLKHYDIMKTGIPTLIPNQTIQFTITDVATEEERRTKPFNVNVTYKNAAGEEFKNTYLIDYRYLLGLRQLD